MKRTIFYKIILFAIVIFATQNLSAQFEEGEKEVTVNFISGDSLLTPVNGSRTLTFTTNGESSKKITNIICFKINEDNPKYLSESFTATVDFTIETTSGTIAKSLTVNFDTSLGAKYNTRAYMILPTQEEMVKITVTAITPNNTTGFNPRLVLQLDNEMRILRYYDLATNPTYLIPSFTSSLLSDALDVSWTWDAGGNTHENMSQLEWTWVEDEMAAFYPNKNNLFTTNSTRVDIDYHNNNYKIPLLYDGVGKLYFRARAALRKNDGNIITGPWSDPDSVDYNGHEPNLNWQASTSFAENGKFKTVIQYFDGTLRTRQTVTKDNTTGNTVVAETIYDLQGRPNIQVLPTPVIGTTIKYFKDFNRFVGMDDTDPEDPTKYFDLTPANVLCNRSVALKKSQGNGQYYSDQNPWLPTEQEAKYIPDANGYAFTETRFMDDATERVRSQGGVGEDHQINSGHETRYFYGKPAQQELDALFATEVGDATHYSKNMVQDANGQMSISYVDMHGRTIATSLAGDATTNMSSIITNSTDYPQASGLLTNQLLTPVNNIINGNSIESISSILVPARTNYNFTYKFDPAIINMLDCNSNHICFDCKYDLEISIKSENCGDTSPVIRRYNNLQIVPADSACSKAMWFKGPGADSILKQITFSDSLDIGSYIIRKTLTVNDSLFRIRRDSALKVFLCKTEQSIYDSVYAVLAENSECGATYGNAISCFKCFTRLGNFSTYKIRYLLALGNPEEYDEQAIYNQYVLDSTECKNLCNGLNIELTTLKTLRNQMLADMIPFNGQYAVDSVRDTLGHSFPLTSSRLESKYNIFTTTLAYSGFTKPFYNHPLNENGQPYYYTDNIEVDSSIHGHDTSNNIILDTISPATFSNMFQRSWANSLIKFHPEYSKLQIAEGVLRHSYEWLDSMQGMDLYSAAHASNFDKPFTIPAAGAHQDPFMISFASSTDRLILDKRIRVGVDVDASGLYASGPSIWQIANGTIMCGTVDSLHKEACLMALPSSAKTGMDPSITDPDEQNVVWEQFRTLYLTYRNELVLKYINAQSGVLSRVDMDTLLEEGKHLIFANNEDLATQNGADTLWTIAASGDTTGLSTAITPPLATLGSDMCVAQRPFWRARLMQCDSLINLLNNEVHSDSLIVNEIIDSILNGMVSVCHHSLTPQQIWGASNVNPSYGGTPQDFEHVINPILQSYGIDTAGASGYFCNPYSIDFPKPFGLNPPVLTNYTNVIDSCGCKRFALLKQEAYAESVDTSSLAAMNAYLLMNYNDTLSAGLWNGLQKCKDMFKDSCYTIYDSVTCPKPLIRNVYYNYSSERMIIDYQPQFGFEYYSCTLKVYDAAFNEVLYGLDCSDSLMIIRGEPCNTYKFVIESTGFDCGTRISDTFYYEGCCPKPVITNIEYQIVDSVINVTYASQPGYTECKLYVGDSLGTINTYSLSCSDSVIVIHDLALDSCKNYYFRIRSYSENCGIVFSDTLRFKNCCEKPIIKDIQLSNIDGYLNVSYQSNPNCTKCEIYVFDDDSLVSKTAVDCGLGTVVVPRPALCKIYSFLMACNSEQCGVVFSDTIHFNPCCPQPRIIQVRYDTVANAILVNYLPQTIYSDCVLNIYDNSMTLITSEPLDCEDSLLTILSPRPCSFYYYQIVSNNKECGDVSSNIVYHNEGCCMKPVINDVYFDYSNSWMQINYQSEPVYTSCVLYAYNTSDSLVSSTTIDCGDSSVVISGTFNACKNYYFIIESTSEDCDEVSDTFYYTGCCPKPKITNVQFIGGNCYVSYIPHINYTECSLLVYIGIDLDKEITIDCNDSLAIIPDLDSCTLYRFQIKSRSEDCNDIYSDFFQNKACNRDITICNHSYNPIYLSLPVVMPPMLGCDYKKPCITCAKLDTLTAEFRLRFPSYTGVPYLLSTATDDQLKQNNLWARFLNYRTGFSKNTMDYLEAYHKCHDTLPPPVFAICAFSPPLNNPGPLFIADTLPCKDVETQAHFIAQQLYQGLKDSLLARFDSIYRTKCLLYPKDHEQFYATYEPKEYHYTLYYYDQAGNLVKTIPPAAAKPDYGTSYLNAIKAAREAGTDVGNSLNNESLATHYRYNTLNQVIAQKTPDAGISQFWYDRLGRLVVSQNAKQQLLNQYSYTLYDYLGRITEVGQSTNSTDMSQTISQDTTALANWIDDISDDTKKQITFTVYDLPYTSIATSLAGQTGLYQKNLRNRVSYSMVFDDESQKNALMDGTYSGGNSATYYSYDIHGNVDTLLQDYRTTMGAVACSNDTSIKGNRFKKIVYDYDLISGKVNVVSYQLGLPDAFYHRYGYDAENKLTVVETSKDKIYWEQDAVYKYYRHGPLSRAVLGQNQVQGLDYAYTIQGWLKGVNSTAVLTTTGSNYDIGIDGPLTLKPTARDIYGYSLNYFTSDYKPIGGASAFTKLTLPLPAEPVSGIATGASLYNGNIAAMAVNIPILGNAQVYGYRYDQLNRIVRMDDITGLANNDTTITAVRSDDYHEETKYDPNGNILAYKRNGYQNSGHLQMDSLIYGYTANTNKLKHVSDDAAFTAFYKSDIDNQPDATNYTYDAIGNLIQDKAEGIDSIRWTVYGKIRDIYKSNSTVIEYTYDASGNRISQVVTKGSVVKKTFYVRDASGNVMSIYGMQDTLKQKEIMLYGSSRLGTQYVNVDVQNCDPAVEEITKFTRGNKIFELSNHLGNVLVTVTDKKRQHSTNGTTVDYYNAEVFTASDYYPFGMLMPGRQVYLDTTSRNVGNTSTTAAPIDTTVVELYRHSFSDTPSTHPYITAPDVLNTGLNTSSWTNSNSAWTSMASNTSMGKAITMMSSIGDTATVTLTVNINSGKKVSIKSFSFYQRANITGYMHWKMYINGIEVGDSALYVPTTGGTGSSTMESIGSRLVKNGVQDLTGNITVLFKLYDHDAANPSGASQGQFRLDDFVLNGFVNDEGAGSATGVQYAQNGAYRYGFNGKENDDEVKGEANQQDYGMRIYDPRLGRFLSVDPITKQYPELTPYQFASNRPIDGIDLDGLEYSPAGDPAAGAYQYYNLDKLAREHGEDPLDYNKSVVNQTAVGHLLSVVIAVDVIFTKGYLTRFVMGQQFLSAFEHNAAKNPELKKAQEDRSKKALADVFITFGVGKLFGVGLNVTSKTLKYATNRFSFAKEFYKEAGYAEEKFVEHVRGTDLTKKVFSQTYPKGTVLERWSFLKDGKPVPGDYYTLPNTNPNTLGIELEGRVKTSVVLEEETTFLQSTAGNISKNGKTLKGGGVQLFQTNVKATVKIVTPAP